MEDLFSINLSVNNKNVVYRVIFEDDKYTFLPEAGDSDLPTFSFRRENDEWHDVELIDEGLKKQATESLEKYLLAQH